jgi:hypothetical protein
MEEILHERMFMKWMAKKGDKEVTDSHVVVREALQYGCRLAHDRERRTELDRFDR